MKNLWRAFLVCFSMYSVLPMPQVEWKKENMKTVFCFFPLIGVLIGGASLGWYYLAAYLGWNCFVYAAVAATIPIFITGGIHMDGYIDTCDALFSYGNTDKKLEILKDPRVGAFGVMYTGVYFLLQFALFTEMKDHPENLILLASGYVVSRVISGIAIVSIKTAKSTGLA
ncbi:MAG: adenosylcobinamide-GDP ribazoletransferase, partial [Oscillospiraceae bacterium]